MVSRKRFAPSLATWSHLWAQEFSRALYVRQYVSQTMVLTFNGILSLGGSEEAFTCLVRGLLYIREMP